MKIIELLQSYWAYLVYYVPRYVDYAQYCMENDIQTTGCRPFWSLTFYLTIAIALLLLLIIGKKIFLQKLEFYRNKKRLALRKVVADPETMKRHLWDPGYADIQLTEEEIAKRLREEIKARAEVAAADSAHKAQPKVPRILH